MPPAATGFSMFSRLRGAGLAHQHPRARLRTGSVLDRVFTCPWQSGETQNLNAGNFLAKINLPLFMYKTPVLVK